MKAPPEPQGKPPYTVALFIPPRGWQTPHYIGSYRNGLLNPHDARTFAAHWLRIDRKRYKQVTIIPGRIWALLELFERNRREWFFLLLLSPPEKEHFEKLLAGGK